jgi:hypothetical protein
MGDTIIEVLVSTAELALVMLPAAEIVEVAIGTIGPPGPAGESQAATLSAGAGLSIVGNEIRMVIGALPIAE